MVEEGCPSLFPPQWHDRDPGRTRRGALVGQGASKFAGWGDNQFQAAGFRAVPGSLVRHSAYIAPGVILMPSFVNLGAYVDSGTMVDSWTTVGSCAQIGKNCHLSGGVGIGGVLEPLQSDPVVIEDNCFIGARAEVAEGVLVGEGSVLAMGVYLSASTRIIERATGEIFYGRVPPFSVVVSERFPASRCPMAARGPGFTARSSSSGWMPKPEPSTDQRFAARLSDELRSDPPGPDPLPVGDAGRGGALDHLERLLKASGFRTVRLPFSEPGTADVDNLYARYGSDRPHLLCGVKDDVVPPGRDLIGPIRLCRRAGGWPGLGAAVDMKGRHRCLRGGGAGAGGGGAVSVSFLITGDEEDAAINGTAKVLGWMGDNGEIPITAWWASRRRASDWAMASRSAGAAAPISISPPSDGRAMSPIRRASSIRSICWRG